MFEPISARLASSFSRNGISDAATETSCFGETSMYSISLRSGENELTALSGGVTLVDDVALFVELDVRLADDVFVLFPRGQVERKRLEFGLLPPLSPSFLFAFSTSSSGTCSPGLNFVSPPLLISTYSITRPSIDLAIRRFDKAELVDTRKARQRRDQSDVRTFRRLDRADAAVVRRVNVADLESGTLTRQTARPESRQTTLVRDLRQRIGLVHELRQLRRAEELANRGRHRLCVDEVARHRRVHVLLDRHLLLDRALHALEADAELIFQQLADRANAAIAEVIDIVRLSTRLVLAHLQKVGNDFDRIARREQRIVDAVALRAAHLDVELQSADARQVKPARVEEHAFEQAISRRHGRRVAGTHLAIDLEQRIDRLGDRVLLQASAR